jgi:hypothetical protein
LQGQSPRPGTSPNGIANDPRQGRQGQTNEFGTRRFELRPPPKPSEFQKFVEGATGACCRCSERPFFADAADTFNPVDNVPVSADYTVGPGRRGHPARLGLDRRRLPHHGRPQRPA